MRKEYLTLIIIGLAFLCGCSNPEKTALDSFKPIVIYLSGLTNSDASASPEYSDFVFKVSKFDSPVNPFVGTISFEKRTHETKYTYTCRFMRQNDKWVHKIIDVNY